MMMPIFAYEPVDLLVFRTVGAAESYLEPIDIENNVYSCFDSTGRKLELQVRSVEKVVIQESTAPLCPDELRKILIEFLSHPKVTRIHGITAEGLKSSSLSDLVTLSIHFETK